MENKRSLLQGHLSPNSIIGREEHGLIRELENSPDQQAAPYIV